MTEREALKLALVALENTTPTGFNMERDKQFFAAITAIREALAQPEQEPVARYFENYQGQPTEEIDEERFNQTPEECRFKLYTAPPQPEPVIDKSAATRIATALGWEPKRKPLEGVIDVQPIGYHSLQLIFRSQTDIAKFKAAHGIKE